jgi:guanylate kinase
MNRRLGAALKEISCIDKYDYRVVNEDLRLAIDTVESIIEAEQCKLNDDEVTRIVERYKEYL